MTAVLMVSGSWPPQACGVGDYADTLSAHLDAAGLRVIRFGDSSFSSLLSPRIIAEIRRHECDIVHIQYPTVGFGRSLTPSLLGVGVRKPMLVTLHEYSSFRPYRRPWFIPFARYCRARIFTNAADRMLFEQRFPERRGFDATIEIASNVPQGRSVPRHLGKVVHFGLIAPHKGIEDFLDFCVIAKAQAGLVLALVGAIPDTQRAYADDIVRRAAALGVVTRLNLPRDQVADELAGATFAYLPFPDGASAKRGSLAAALVNGLAVITPLTAQTPDWIRSATVDAASPREAFDAVMRLRRDPVALQILTARTREVARRLSWDAIVDRHGELYERVLGRADGAPLRRSANALH
jgi:glycosyltransferase involved in cell wall biosynthesis